MIKSTRTMPRIRQDNGDITDQADPVVKRTVAWLAAQSSPHITTLEKICNEFWIPENICFTVNVDARVLQKV